MTKILIFGSGRSYHVSKWANKFSSMGYDVIVVSLHKFERPFVNKINKIYYDGPFKYIMAIILLWQLIHKQNIDTVQLHSAGFYGLMTFFLPKFVRRFLFVYGSDVFLVPDKSKFHKLVVKAILKSNFKVISSSNAMRTRVLELIGVRYEEKISTVPFGIDRKIFYAKTKVNPKKTRVIGIVKKLEIIYGIDILILAFAKLINLDKNFKLMIVGDGTQKSYLEELCAELKISDKVSFVDAVPNIEVPSYLNEMDVFAVPSRSESFGVAAIEAMAAGVPVVVSNVGGLPEVVDFGNCGLIFQSESIDDLYEQLSVLLTNPFLRHQLSSRAIQKVKFEYDLDSNFRDLESLIYE